MADRIRSCSEIRESFLDYYARQGHEVVPGGPLVPANDPTLLFTNSGMVQFKDVFLGHTTRKNPRAASAQCCIRAGGKHNDLEQVGYTARHHTFFEMLGNFSFGDYFKEAAIHYAWDYLTQVLQLPQERLWVTIYEQDDEAATIWLDRIGIAPDSFSRCGEQDNFWTMGNVGPCGPCSEIYYDHGAELAGTPPGTDGEEGDRFVEIWNLVFTQYDRDKDGELHPIPHPSVDTGMGLERISAVLQKVHDNYDTELFQTLIQAIPASITSNGLLSARVIADHIRSSAFLISEGVNPGNVGRSYVLRRIIRRAIRHGHKLGIERPFLSQLLPALEQQMGDFYPLLGERRQHTEKVLLNEEERFAQTLGEGLKRLAEVIDNTDGETIAGEEAFRLYDTYGFPMDLTADIARENGMHVDTRGFNRAMAKQRQRAKGSSQFDTPVQFSGDVMGNSTFTGHTQLEQQTIVEALYQDGREVNTLKQGELGGVVLRETPFYAQSGGQIGDRGELVSVDDDSYFEVEDTRKQGQSHVHLGVLRTGTLKTGDAIMASVDSLRRLRIMRNHSATHLLHAALRQHLGTQVEQKGSLVADDRLRFDFSWDTALSKKQLTELEHLVNARIMANAPTTVQIMPLEAARRSGALMLFGEKYADEVRVLSIGGEFSRELCGGTHVQRCGDIGLFRIISESGVASGIRRIEASTGDVALQMVQENEHILQRLATLLKTDNQQVESRLCQHLEKTRLLEKKLDRLHARLAHGSSDDIATKAQDINGVKVLTHTMEETNIKTMRDMVDTLKDKLGNAALILACVANNERVHLVAGVTKNNTDRIKAGELVNFVARQVGGSGGGRADMAQAGGSDPSALPAALASVPDWIRQVLATTNQQS